MPEPQPKSMEELVSLCKRRGFIYPASEIYGGLNGFWDYGPLVALLKKNLADDWWRSMVLTPPRGPVAPTATVSGTSGRRVQIVGVDSAIIQNPKVWEASGHVAGFNDPMVDCTESKKRYRADKVWAVGFFRGDIEQSWQELKAKLQEKERSVADFEYGSQLLKAASEWGSAIAPKGSGPFDKAQVEVFLQRFGQLNKEIRHALSVLNSPGLNEELAEHNQTLKEAESLIQPAFVRGAEAESESQAYELAVASLSKRDRASLGDDLAWAAYDVLHLPENWPKVSPATQKPTLTEPRPFNLMFPTIVGATGDWEENKAYLRPETAQGIFTNFKNVCDTMRVRVPFGIAQIGKAFRNEVTPRNFIFRSREFEQMEMEWFCHESEAGEWLEFWKNERLAWWKKVGLSADNLQLRQHEQDELAHYAKTGHGTWDIEYRWPFTDPGFGELEGVAHRSNYDLTQHEKASGQKLSYFDQERNERFIPHVVEPAAGLTRGVLALLCEAFTPDESRPSKVFMKFEPRMAPIKAAVYPLVNKDGMPEVAEKLHDELTAKFGGLGMIEYDPKQNIGKRYARMDEAGCPYCFTIDSDTLKDQTVTIRHRDDQRQERIALDKVAGWLAERIL